MRRSVMNGCVESIISSELAKELGGGTDVVVISGKKRKKSEHTVPPKLPQREMQKLEKMSKSKAKQHAQILKKKERASRQGSYVSVIKNHELTLSQRELLLPSTKLNQQATLRQQVQHLYRKEKVGINLSEEEQSLLYDVRRAENKSLEFGQQAEEYDCRLPIKRCSDKAMSYDSTELSSPSTLLSLGELFAAPNPHNLIGEDNGSSAVVSSKKKERKTSRSAMTSACYPVTDATPMEVAPQPQIEMPVGQRLLKCFANIKNRQQTSVASGQLPRAIEISQPTTLFSSEFDKQDIDKSCEVKSEVSQRNVPLSKSTVTSERSDIAIVADDSLDSLEFLSYRRPIRLHRLPELCAERLQLPVCSMEQEIIEAVMLNDVVLLAGETGSGKSTQLPQFLLEAGFAPDCKHLVGVTMPRRVAVTSAALRVQYEIGETLAEVRQLRRQDRRRDAMGQISMDKSKSESDGIDSEIAEKEEETFDQSKYEADEDNKRDGDSVYSGDISMRAHLLYAQRLRRSGSPGHRVGYHIRHDSSTVGGDTRLLFMTEGILLQELGRDPLLRRFSVLVLDEAHERHLHTDLLLGWLSRLLPLRRQLSKQEQQRWSELSEEQRQDFESPICALKVVVMSATLDKELFASFFPAELKVAQVTVPARRFPVTRHFARSTSGSQEYERDVLRLLLRMHRQLPPGGILVFLPGKKEIENMQRRLSQILRGENKAQLEIGCEEEANGDSKANDDSDDNLLHREDEDEVGDEFAQIDHDDDSNSDAQSDSDSDSDTDSLLSDVPFDPLWDADPDKQIDTAALRAQMLARALGRDAISETEGSVPLEPPQPQQRIESRRPRPQTARVLPLHAQLSMKQQQRVFEPLDARIQRLVVLATNVAETSLTIPAVRFVLDSGRCRTRVGLDVDSRSPESLREGTQDDGTNQQEVEAQFRSAGSAVASRFCVHWVSRAAADQRAGRAGRTGPGHVYSVYSAAFYHDHMRAQTPPEISLVSLQDLVLQMAALGISDVERFPFPTPPPRSSLLAAQHTLHLLGALHRQAGEEVHEVVLTPLGRLLRALPLCPRLAKVLVLGLQSAAAQMSIEFGSEYGSGRRWLWQLLTFVVALSEPELFLSQTSQNSQSLRAHPRGDVFARSRAVGAALHHLEHLLELRLRAQGPQNLQTLGALRGLSRLVQEEVRGTQMRSFCMQYGLSETALSRCLGLRDQLAALAQTQIFPRLGATTQRFVADLGMFPVVGPPSTSEEVSLLHLLGGAYPDRIAKRLSPAELHRLTPEGSARDDLSAKLKRSAFMSCDPDLGSIPVFLHPSSSVAQTAQSLDASAAQFVLYGAVSGSERGVRLYLTQITPLGDPDLQDLGTVLWESPLLHVSRDAARLLQPSRHPVGQRTTSPHYLVECDAVVCAVRPLYGALDWALAPLLRPLRDVLAKLPQTADPDSGVLGLRVRDLEHRWFLRCLLQGECVERCALPLQTTLLADAAQLSAERPSQPQLLALLRHFVQRDLRSVHALAQSLRGDAGWARQFRASVQALLRPAAQSPFSAACDRWIADVREANSADGVAK